MECDLTDDGSLFNRAHHPNDSHGKNAGPGSGVKPKRIDETMYPDNWFALSNWGKITGNLTDWERAFSYNMGMLLRRRRPLSEKQSAQAQRIFAKATELGFKVRKGDPARRWY